LEALPFPFKNAAESADRTGVTGSVHLRGIVIAGGLAAVALCLAFVTLVMNQKASGSESPHTVLSLKARHAAATGTPATHVTTTAKPKPKPNPNYVAAVQAGLPRSIARALAAHQVVVIELTSPSDPVAALANGEAKVGARLAKAGFVPIDVDKDTGDAPTLTAALDKVPVAPAVLVYVRPATLAVTLSGFNDRTVVQQAVASALAGLTNVTGDSSGSSGGSTTTPASVASPPGGGSD
jgi:hypothetical protein